MFKKKKPINKLFMFKKKKPIKTESARIITINSVVDGKLTKIEGYLTDTPINNTSKLIRHQDEGMEAINKFFTKK